MLWSTMQISSYRAELVCVCNFCVTIVHFFQYLKVSEVCSYREPSVRFASCVLLYSARANWITEYGQLDYNARNIMKGVVSIIVKLPRMPVSRLSLLLLILILGSGGTVQKQKATVVETNGTVMAKTKKCRIKCVSLFIQSIQLTIQLFSR